MDADDDEAIVFVLLVPRLDVGQGSKAVDAGVGPEIDENDLAAKRFRSEWRGVDPGGRAGELGKRWCGPIVGGSGCLTGRILAVRRAGPLDVGVKAVDEALFQAGGAG